MADINSTFNLTENDNIDNTNPTNAVDVTFSLIVLDSPLAKPKQLDPLEKTLEPPGGDKLYYQQPTLEEFQEMCKEPESRQSNVDALLSVNFDELLDKTVYQDINLDFERGDLLVCSEFNPDAVKELPHSLEEKTELNENNFQKTSKQSNADALLSEYLDEFVDKKVKPDINLEAERGDSLVSCPPDSDVKPEAVKEESDADNLKQQQPTELNENNVQETCKEPESKQSNVDASSSNLLIDETVKPDINLETERGDSLPDSDVKPEALKEEPHSLEEKTHETQEQSGGDNLNLEEVKTEIKENNFQETCKEPESKHSNVDASLCEYFEKLMLDETVNPNINVETEKSDSLVSSPPDSDVKPEAEEQEHRSLEEKTQQDTTCESNLTTTVSIEVTHPVQENLRTPEPSPSMVEHFKARLSANFRRSLRRESPNGSIYSDGDDASIVDFQSLMEASPSLVSEKLPTFEKQCDLKLKICNLQQRNAKLKLELKKNEEILMKFQTTQFGDNQANLKLVEIIAELRNENSRLREELEEAEAKQAETQKLKSENKALQEILTEFERTVTLCVKNEDQLKEQLRKEQSELKELKDENNKLKYKYVKMFKEYEEAIATSKGLRTQGEQYQREIKRLETSLLDYSKKCEEVKAHALQKIEEANKEILKLQEERDQAVKKRHFKEH